MIKVNLNDPKLAENLEALRNLKSTGLYSDEALQELYDKQVETDKTGGRDDA